MITVAEIGINHNGDIDIAKKLIDVAALARCDYVKFQKRTVEKVYTPEELDRPRESPWGTTNRHQKNGLEFSKSQYDEINHYCRIKNIGWFASPWDVESVDFLAWYNPEYMKVASACVTDVALLERIKETQRPVILSTGMSTHDEVLAACDILGEQVCYLLACTSTYPAAPAEMNMQFIRTLQDFEHNNWMVTFPRGKIGFSNHSPGLTFCLVAAALGAEMIEFHITLDRSMYGSDQAASIEPQGVLALMKHLKAIEVGMGSGEWTVFESEEQIKRKLRRC